MKHTGKVTLLTAALLALSAHAVAAETTQTETTVQPTTAEVTTVQPTTEATTTSNASLPTDSKNDVDIHVYKPGEEPKYTGIYKADGETYYQVDSKPITNTWKWHGGRWYYFGEDGKMFKSTVTPDGYLVDIEGMLVSPGWSFQGGKWYYALSGGKVFSGDWKKIGGVWYAFHDNGVMYAHEWSGSYFLKDSGAMADNEWIYDKNYSGYFYLKEDGVYVTNIFTIDGKKHAFQDNGLWIAEIPEPVTYGEYKNVVFLDPGHGGRDPGAVYNGLREKDLNMSIYRKLRSELEKLGYTVLTSRDKDVYVDYITERSEMVNKTDADVFISIHFNATGVPGANRSGVETYIYEPDDDIKPRINKVAHDNPVRLSESKRLADNIHNSVVSVAGANDRGVHGSNYAVLRETVKPAVLIELGYMDSPEYKKISDDKYQNKLVEGLVKGLRNFYKTAK